MEEILKVNEETMTVSARDLYDAVNGGKERFSKWFNRQLQYGFEDGIDYKSGMYQKVRSNQYGGEKTVEDYALSVWFGPSREVTVYRLKPKQHE